MELHTPRLKLAPRRREEVRAEIEALSPEDKTHVSPAWLRLLEDSAEMDPWVHGFQILHLESGRAVGQCGFKGPPDRTGVVEIAYCVNLEHRGRGYATEAAKGLVSFAFAHSQVQIVRAHTLPEPNASTRVLAKAGFRLTGEVIDPEDGPVWRWEMCRETAPDVDQSGPTG